MNPGRRGYRVSRAVANAGTWMEAPENNCVIHSNTPYLRAVYQGGKDTRVQLVAEVLVSGLQPGGRQTCKIGGGY